MEDSFFKNQVSSKAKASNLKLKPLVRNLDEEGFGRVPI